jgi:hypothetical protein
VTTTDELLNRVWGGLGAEYRELTRGVLAIIVAASPVNRPKLLAHFFWVNGAGADCAQR